MTMRKCLKCSALKPRDSFYGLKHSQSYCKPCQNALAKEWREANKEKLKEYKKAQWASKPEREKINNRLRSRYGITIEQYEAMYVAQTKLCAICNGPEILEKRLGVDHCHSTGKVRGLLCDRCNTLIGRAKEDRSILKSAIAYLDYWTAK